MLDIILEKEISELVERGIVLIDREEGLFTISTNRGIIGVKQEGEKWQVGFLLLNWELAYDEINKGNQEHITIPSEQKTLPFEDALETAMGYLSTILPTGYTQNMNLN